MNYNLDIAAGAYARKRTWWWQWRRRRAIIRAYMKGAADMNHSVLKELAEEMNKAKLEGYKE